MPRRTSDNLPRFSVSHLPLDVEPEEKEFVKLLERALAPSFALVKRLGSGGMGAVYLARDPVLKRLVAVKVMAPSLAADPEARARFEREAQAVASISHPNVVSVFSVGELENGVPYLVMQYVEGRTLSERLEEDGPLDARTAKRFLGEVSSALAAAHKRGIIHRDIKPANILCDDDTGRALVTDFGIAAVLERGDERDATRITHTGMAIGTPAYMSPEQLLAEPVTDKTDIYSLGLLGYEMFIGEGPYVISSPREMMAAHLRDTPRRLSTMRGDIDPELERLLEGCLAKDPKQRPTAREVESRLVHGASVLLEWPPPRLEHLGASLRSALRTLLIGAMATGIPLAALSVFDRESFVRQTLPPPLFILALTGVGLITFCAGLLGLGRFFYAARKAVAAGYGWGTVAETAADVRGDTGGLIAGGREYAELAPETRNAMRRNRLIAAVLRILAGLAPVLGYVIGIMIAARSANGPVIVLWSSILLSLTLLAGARLIEHQENRAMQTARRRLRTATAKTGALDKLAEAWTASFEQVRAGQSLGSGSTKYGRSIMASAGVVLALSAVGAVLAFLILTLTTTVGVYGEIRFPKFSNTRSTIARIQRLAAYRVTPDTTITPLRAGQALHAITRDGPGGPLAKFEKPPAISISPQPQQRRANDPFEAEGGWNTAAFRSASRGFTVAQRDFLRATADNSAMEEFRILARAPGLDFVSAYWDLEPASGAVWMLLPIPRFAALRTVANANAAQAALDLSAGRRDVAERRLRETLSAGFLLVEGGHTAIENIMGANIVNTARGSLGAFFEATGRTRDARYVSAADDPVITIIGDGRTRMPADQVARAIRRIVLDTTEPLGLRWEMMLAFSIEPCGDPHQVIFGPDSLHLTTLAQAQERLARSHADSQLFALVSRAIIAPIQGPRRGVQRATAPVARTISALTGNRQLESCLSLFGAAF